jgi:hypothetical protein
MPTNDERACSDAAIVFTTTANGRSAYLGGRPARCFMSRVAAASRSLKASGCLTTTFSRRSKTSQPGRSLAILPAGSCPLRSESDRNAALPRNGAMCQLETNGIAAICNGKSQRYSMTSSARPSSKGGTSRPSALAVLRLMTSSNFVGC